MVIVRDPRSLVFIKPKFSKFADVGFYVILFVFVFVFWVFFYFYGISTFVGYLMPKPFSLKNSSGTI